MDLGGKSGSTGEDRAAAFPPSSTPIPQTSPSSQQVEKRRGDRQGTFPRPALRPIFRAAVTASARRPVPKVDSGGESPLDGRRLFHRFVDAGFRLPTTGGSKGLRRRRRRRPQVGRRRDQIRRQQSSGEGGWDGVISVVGREIGNFLP